MKHNYSLIALFSLIYLTLSAFLFFAIPTWEGHREIDSGEYEVVAQNFVKTGYLFHEEMPLTMPFHTIGYHLFLGTIYTIFGSCSNGALIIIQVLLGLACCWLTYALAYLLFGSTVALLSLALAACNLGFLVYAQLVMSDMLLMTFLLSFLVLFSQFTYDQKFIKLFASICILSFSVLIKPVALYYLFPLGLFVWGATKKGTKIKLMTCFLCACIFYIPLLGYMAYNKSMFGVVAVTQLVQENLYVYFLPSRILPRLEPELRQTLKNKIDACDGDVDQRMRVSAEIFKQLLLQRPLIFCAAWIESMVKVFLGTYATQLKGMFNTSVKGGSCSFFNMQGKSAVDRLYRYATFGAENIFLKMICCVDVALLLIRYIFIFLALFFLLQSGNYFWFLFFSIFIGYFTFVTGHDGGGRYRMMFESLLIILAAYACIEIYLLIQRRFFRKQIQGVVA